MSHILLFRMTKPTGREIFSLTKYLKKLSPFTSGIDFIVFYLFSHRIVCRIESFICLFLYIVAAAPLAQSIVIKLPRLKRLAVSGICTLFCFVKAAPNLDYLEVSFDCLKNLLDDELTCHLLQQRIARLDIYDWLGIDVDLLKNVSRVFTNLRQLIVGSKDLDTIIDPTILAAIAHWHDKPLYWFFINGSLSDQAKTDLRQWLIDHTHLTSDDSFAAEYNDNWFILWK